MQETAVTEMEMFCSEMKQVDTDTRYVSTTPEQICYMDEVSGEAGSI